MVKSKFIKPKYVHLPSICDDSTIPFFKNTKKVDDDVMEADTKDFIKFDSFVDSENP
jgi:hypothetical protein